MILQTQKVNYIYKNLLKKLFEKTLCVTENQAENLIVGVAFVQPEEIQKLNKEKRNVDKVTDVLSFPMLDIDYKKSKLKNFQDEREPNGQLYIGDIVICLKRAKEQAKEYQHSNKREICYLAVHGFLHLLGYDHIEKEDESVMTKIAEEIMQDFNIRR